MHTVTKLLNCSSCKRITNHFRKFGVSTAKEKDATISRLKFRQFKDQERRGRPIAAGEYALLVSVYWNQGCQKACGSVYAT